MDKKVEKNSVQSESNLSLQKSIEDIQKKLIDIENSSVEVRGAETRETVYYPTPKNNQCCCFEIVLYRARVLKGQGGPGSVEVGDGGGLANTNMEVILGATADGFSAAYPDVASHAPMSEGSGWLICNKKIALVSGGQSIAVAASARELDGVLVGEPQINGRGEFGASESAYLNLTCDCPVIPVQLEVRLGGGSINRRGLILVEITAKKVCCPCC